MNGTASIASVGLRTWRPRFVALSAAAAMLNGCGGSSSGGFVEPPPAGAIQVGYLIRTFSSTFTPQTVDTAATERPGFQWYNWDFYGFRSDPNAVVINADGSITLNRESGGAGGQLVTAVQDRARDPFVGNSFGGGAYIEAVLKWQPLLSFS